MTADRARIETMIRGRLRSLNKALNTDPIDRARVTELSTRLCDGIAGLPGDLTPLENAIDHYAQRAGLWAVFGYANDADELVVAGKAVELHRTALMVDGERVPY